MGRSCILVSIAGKNVMLDCGMHMGFNDDVSPVGGLSPCSPLVQDPGSQRGVLTHGVGSGRRWVRGRRSWAAPTVSHTAEGLGLCCGRQGGPRAPGLGFGI